jgi:PAS domain S-box-containing protein
MTNFQPRDDGGEQRAGDPSKLQVPLHESLNRQGQWDASMSDDARDRLGAVGIDAINTMLVVADMKAKDQPLVFVNGYFLEFTGYNAEEVLGRNCRFLQRRSDGSLDDRQSELNKIRHAIKHKQFVRATLRNYRKDGVMFWNEVYLTPVLGQDGDLDFMVGVQNNISEQVRAIDSNRLISSVIHDNQDGILIVHAGDDTGEGPIVRANEAFEKLTNVSVDQIAGQNTGDVLPTFLGRSAYHRLRTELARTGRFQQEVEVRGRGQQKQYVQYTVTPVLDEYNGVKQWCHLLRDITERRQLEADIRDIHGYEQKRIARDLHDGVAQDLSIAALSATRLRLEVDDPEIQATLTSIYEDIRNAAHQTRSIAHGLMPADVEHLGLAAALAALARRTQDHGLAQCEFNATANHQLADSEHEVHLYHIAREAVSNAIRHGHPEKIWLTLRIIGDQGELIIEDDGSGFSESKNLEGIGVRTMRSRARLIGGDLAVELSELGGVRVICRFPYRPRVDFKDEFRTVERLTQDQVASR